MADDLRDALQRALGDAYHIDRELAAGGMSRLFLATERSIGREVVVKVLPTELTNDVSAARFRREIEVTAHLQHPHILPVFTAGASGDLLYYVMPYIKGESLRHRLTRERQLPVADAMRILGEAADALGYAHQRGIVHRDIKPENILLSEGHAVLADFGIARALLESRAAGSLTATGLGLGTPGYMPPEQVTGERSLDARADVYSLAVVGYEMLAGLPPFTGPSAQAVIAAHLTSDARPLRELRRDVPPSIADALHRGMAKEPDHRFQSAAEFARALAVTPAVRTPAPSRWLPIAGASAVVVALAAWAVLGRSTPPAVDANLLAVAPFDVIEPAPAVFREGLVDVVSRSLDGAGALRTVSPSFVIRRWQGRADPASATALARSAGAGLAVFGTVVPTSGDSVRLDATVYDVATGARVGEGDVRVSDSRERIDRITDSLSVRLLRVLSGARRTGTPRLGALGTQSLPALKAFLRGERLYRLGAYDSASVAYEEAFTIDSNFALALNHGADARGWVKGQGDATKTEWRLRAGRLVAGLPTRDSLRLLADSVGEAIGRGLSIDDRIALARHGFDLINELTRRWPDDAEVWYRFGEAHLHNGTGLAGASQRQILAAFERSVGLDSTFGPAYEHVLHLELIVRRDTARALQYADRYLGLSGDSTTRTTARFMTAVLRAPRRDDEALARAMAAIPRGNRRNAFYMLGGYADREELGARLARVYVSRVAAGDSITPFMRGLGAASLAFRGHFQEADGYLGERDVLRVRPQLLMMGVPVDSAEPLVRRVLAEALQPDARGAYAYIPWLAQRRDTAALAALLASATARQRSTDQAVARFEHWAANAVRAYAALARADTVAALGVLQSLPDSICVLLCDELQLLEAQLLSSRGRFAAADTVLSYERPGPAALPVTVLVYLERARVAEHFQRRRDAIEWYSLVADAWASGDASARPFAAEASQGLRRLGGQSGESR